MLLVRRVVGKSMLPQLREGQLVVGWRVFTSITPGNLVIFRHNGLEKIKRVAKLHNKQVFVVGDNQADSTDSRSFGPVPYDAIVAKVIWPRR